MISLRSVVFLSIFAIALWGLFRLMGNLSEPGLLRTEKAVLVKGCDPIESEKARQECPQFFCEKAILDRKLTALRSRFDVTVQKNAPPRQLIGGFARETAGSAPVSFACVIENGKVTEATTLDADVLEQLAAQSDGWTLLAIGQK
jgi:hypothetical protein